MHQLIATMERDRLIERRPDEANRRILRAWLTEHGAAVLRACHRASTPWRSGCSRVLTPEEAATFGAPSSGAWPPFPTRPRGDADGGGLRDAS